jgi:hypothetical protein
MQYAGSSTSGVTMNTIQHPIAVGIIVAVVVFLIIREVLFHSRTKRVDEFDDIRELRHTIRVNCGILIRELGELSGIANRAAPSVAVTDAKRLLHKASLVADDVPHRINSGDTESLGELLTEVFGAMNKSTNARRLLGACQPYSRIARASE